MADQIAEERPSIKDLRNKQVLHTDLGKLHLKAKENYADLATLQFPNGETMTPYYHMVLELAEICNPYKDVFDSVRKNWDKLALVFFPQSIHGRIEENLTKAKKSSDYQLGGSQYVSKQLINGGIQAPVDLLVSSTYGAPVTEIVAKYSGKGNRRIMDILENAQEEYLKVLHATRIFEETRLVLGKIAPFIPWPKKDLLPFTTYREAEADWMINGFCGVLEGGQKHLVGIVEISSDPHNFRLEARETDIKVTGGLANKYVLSAHEAAGHASFIELYPEEVAEEVFGMKRKRDKNSIADILTEGYAMYIEDVAARLPGTLGPNREYLGDYGVDVIRKNRVDGLAKIITTDPEKVKPDAKTYTNGASIIRTILRQLGLTHEASETQLVKLREILRAVDIKRASEIVMGSDEYFAILIDPLKNLPRVET